MRLPNPRGCFRRRGIGLEMAQKATHPYPRLGAKGAGRPDWRRVGGDLPTTPREARPDQVVLTAPVYRVVIAAKKSPPPVHFELPVIGVEMAPRTRRPSPRLGPRDGVAGMGLGLPRIPHDIPDAAGRSLGNEGARFPPLSAGGASFRGEYGAR